MIFTLQGALTFIRTIWRQIYHRYSCKERAAGARVHAITSALSRPRGISGGAFLSKIAQTPKNMGFSPFTVL
jgi:hypothetical protein